MMIIHELKVWEEFYPWILNSSKTFELRKNDRNFKDYDILHLREWDKDTHKYTGRDCLCRVGFVLQGGEFGLEEGFCIMSIQLIN